MRTLPLLLCLAALAMPVAAEPSGATVWLIRHAEAGSGGDPPLTSEGATRADAWHGQLGAPTIAAVYTTPITRAEQTARAIAADADDVPVRHYDHRALPELVRTLRGAGESAVVVGHSNTTPDLADLLGVAPGQPIRHDEHDRVYTVTIEGRAPRE